MLHDKMHTPPLVIMINFLTQPPSGINKFSFPLPVKIEKCLCILPRSIKNAVFMQKICPSVKYIFLPPPGGLNKFFATHFSGLNKFSYPHLYSYILTRKI